MISRIADDSLRAILAVAQNQGTLCTSRRISEQTGIPGAYLSKLMQGLVRAGLVQSQRGLHGGFTLVRKPEELTIWEVIDAVEPLPRIHKRPLSIRPHDRGLRPLHRWLAEAEGLIEKALRDTTVAEILAEEWIAELLSQETPTTSQQSKCKAAQHADRRK